MTKGVMGISTMDYVRQEINKRFSRGANKFFPVKTSVQSMTQQLLGDSIKGEELCKEDLKRLGLFQK